MKKVAPISILAKPKKEKLASVKVRSAGVPASVTAAMAILVASSAVLPSISAAWAADFSQAATSGDAAVKTGMGASALRM